MKGKRPVIVLALIATVVAGAFIYADNTEKMAPKAPDFGKGQWLNSKPLTMKELRGKVVLVDFWEYTCINCLRTLPYLKTWNKRYKKYGLVIVGVHTPEFKSSSIPANVKAAVKRLGVTWPVLLDNNYQTWNAYQNRWWPREILIDRKGRIRYNHIGEGHYDRTERMIQKLLAEGGKAPDIKVMAPVRKTDVPGAACYLTTPETYIGSNRGTLSNPRYLGEGTHFYAALGADQIKDGKPALQGRWSTFGEYCQSKSAFSKLLLRYHAAGCYVVADAGPTHTSATMQVLLDGKPVPPKLRGEDIQVEKGKTVVKLGRTRLYRLVGGNVFGRHVVELDAPEGARFYSFTFGTCVH
jgi:thiol-disulfide isomerase/thioredoxin